MSSGQSSAFTTYWPGVHRSRISSEAWRRLLELKPEIDKATAANILGGDA